MITTRLNRLLKAYRHSKALIGQANRGRALPGPAFRMCHKIRRAVWAEIEHIARLIPHIRAANNKQRKATMPMQNEAGESVQSINKGMDDRAMRDVISALTDGARLRVHTKIRKAAVEGLPDKDTRNGRTISITRLKRLEKEGVIREVAMDRYELANSFELKA